MTRTLKLALIVAVFSTIGLILVRGFQNLRANSTSAKVTINRLTHCVSKTITPIEHSVRLTLSEYRL